MASISIVNGKSFDWNLGEIEVKIEGYTFYKSSTDPYTLKFYIGRKYRRLSLEESVLHSPYKITSGYNRNRVVELFDIYFDDKIKDVNSSISNIIQVLLKQMLLGNNIELVCWCKPLECHGDKIVDHVTKLYKKASVQLKYYDGIQQIKGIAELHQVINYIVRNLSRHPYTT
jgi:hypothetical protein